MSVVVALPFLIFVLSGAISAAVVLRAAARKRAAGSPVPAMGRPRGAVGAIALAFGIAVGVVLLLGLLGVLLVAPRVEVASQTHVELPPAPAPAASFQWENAMSREPSLPRDPHTSMKTLKAFMAASVETALRRASADEDRPQVWVIGDEKVPQELVSHLRRELKAQSPKSSSKDVPAADAVVRLRWSDPPASVSVPWWPQPVRQGTLVADVSGPHISESIQAKLEERPWLSSSAPATMQMRDYIIVTSFEPTAATRDEAIDRLNQAKTNAVASLVEPQVAALSSQWHARAEDIRSQVQARYTDAGTPFEDVVVQRVDRPLGSVWYAAGLVRVPTSEVSRMAHAAQTVSNDRRAGWANMIGGAAGMLLVLLVLYAIMNAITRGYFRAHLRTAVAIVLALAVVVMFLRMA
jgi:hypothetical protein